MGKSLWTVGPISMCFPSLADSGLLSSGWLIFPLVLSKRFVLCFVYIRQVVEALPYNQHSALTGNEKSKKLIDPNSMINILIVVEFPDHLPKWLLFWLPLSSVCNDTKGYNSYFLIGRPIACLGPGLNRWETWMSIIPSSLSSWP